MTRRGAAAGGAPRTEAGRAAWSLVGWLALLVVMLAWLAWRPEPPPPPPGAPQPYGADPELPPLVEALPTAPPATSRPTAASTPRASSAEYVVPWRAAATAAPTPWQPAPTPTRWPTPAPRPCAEYSWTWGDSPAVIGQVLVEVRVRNRCGRRLEALEVMFRAEGRRGGDLMYAGQGNLLEPIYPDSVRTVMIALPGSRTFFDAVEVVPVNPPVR